MQQFNVHKIGPEIKIAGIDLSFTNASLFMVISASAIMLFLFNGVNLMHHLNRCRLILQKRKPVKMQLKFPSQLMLLKN